MKQIGLTGGIASGKSLLSEILIKLGVSVYNADKNAAALMESDTGLIEELKKIVGSDAYINGKLNKSLFTEIIFNNPELRNKINSAVHPLVWNKWNEWCGSHSCSYVIIESALLFQTGFFNKLDAVIVVNSVEEVRVSVDGHNADTVGAIDSISGVVRMAAANPERRNPHRDGPVPHILVISVVGRQHIAVTWQRQVAVRQGGANSNAGTGGAGGADLIGWRCAKSVKPADVKPRIYVRHRRATGGGGQT